MWGRSHALQYLAEVPYMFEGLDFGRSYWCMKEGACFELKVFFFQLVGKNRILKLKPFPAYCHAIPSKLQI